MYAVEMTPSENESAVLVGKYEYEAEAVEVARATAADAEEQYDTPYVVVNDSDGNMVWSNEGDWKNDEHHVYTWRVAGDMAHRINFDTMIENKLEAIWPS